MSCSMCDRDAVIYLRYSGNHLCRDHFLESVRKRVYSEFHRQVHLRGDETIAFAYSGGKDSSAGLLLLRDILTPMRGVELKAIMVDEGIAGYRDQGLQLARDFCRELDIELIEKSISDELGITLDQIADLERIVSTCTYCGVFRRKILNSTARGLGASYLATGLNLDDTVQGVLMNIFRGDIERLARMGPHETVQEGLIPRIQPLRRIPEKESLLFCLLEGLEFNDRECPYAKEAVRNVYREMIAKMEEDFPGTRYSLLSGYDSMRDALRESYPPAELRTCACGEPSIDNVCKSCALLTGLKETHCDAIHI